MILYDPKKNKGRGRHLWFAWFPVRTQTGEVVWLEYVDRLWWADKWEYHMPRKAAE